MARKEWCSRCGTEHAPNGPCPLDTGTTGRSRGNPAQNRGRRRTERGSDEPKVIAHPARWAPVGNPQVNANNFTLNFHCQWKGCARVKTITAKRLGASPPDEWHPAVYD